MTARPIFRPMSFLRAVCRMTASLTGNTVPARSRAILYFGHSVMVIDFVRPRCGLGPEPMGDLDGSGRPLFVLLFEDQASRLTHRRRRSRSVLRLCNAASITRLAGSSISASSSRRSRSASGLTRTVRAAVSLPDICASVGRRTHDSPHAGGQNGRMWTIFSGFYHAQGTRDGFVGAFNFQFGKHLMGKDGIIGRRLVDS